jgi:hypothetical protein
MPVVPLLRFDCPVRNCGAEVEDVDFELPTYEMWENAEGLPARETTTKVRCDKCGIQHQVTITNDGRFITAALEEYPKAEVYVAIPDDSDQTDYEEYLASFRPEEPYAQFMHAQEQLAQIAHTRPNSALDAVFNQMLFIQHIVYMEAYLSDRLLTLVQVLPEVRLRLLQNYPPLQAQKLPLQAFEGNPNIVIEKVTSHLKSLVYHDIEAVDALYQHALDQSIFTDATRKSFLKEATIKRHDIVHRNGKKLDGTYHFAMTIFEVRELALAVYELVHDIERRFKHVISKVPSPYDDLPF